MRKTNKLALIGMIGCGKTTVGRIIAERTGAKLIDVDEYIVKKTGRMIRDIFDCDGENEFRRIEFECLDEIIAEEGSAVISCGGGIVTYELSRKLLIDSDECTCVWIKRDPNDVLLDPAVLARPPANGSPERYIKLYEARIPLYTAAQNLTFENKNPLECAKKIIKELEL